MTSTIYVGFMVFDNLPWDLIFCGFASQMVHGFIMKNFPYVTFMSVPFLSAVILLIVNHFLAFKFFGATYYPLSEIMAFFTLCIWMVPFALFVSLSANDQVLPTLSSERTPLLGDDDTKNSKLELNPKLFPDNDDVVTNYFSRKKKASLLSLFNYAKDSILPQRTKKSF